MNYNLNIGSYSGYEKPVPPQLRTPMAQFGQHSLVNLGGNDQREIDERAEKRRKQQSLADFQLQQIHERKIKQEMDRIKRLREEEIDEQRRQRYKKDLYERHIKEKLDPQEFNRNVYESVDFQIEEEEEEQKEEEIDFNRWQLPKEFPDHVKKWILESVGTEFGNLKMDINLHNDEIINDLAGVNDKFNTLINQNNIMEEKINNFGKVVRNAKMIEELRKKEIWFNICKSMPANTKHEDSYKYTPNDYYNKKPYQSNEEINNQLDRIIKLDSNYMTDQAPQAPQEFIKNKKNQYLGRQKNYSQTELEKLEYKMMVENKTYNDIVKTKDDNLFLHYNYQNMPSQDPANNKFGHYLDLKKKTKKFNDLAMEKYFKGLGQYYVKSQLEEIERNYLNGDRDAGDQALKDFEKKYIPSSNEGGPFIKNPTSKVPNQQKVEDIYNLDKFVQDLDYYQNRYS